MLPIEIVSISIGLNINPVNTLASINSTNKIRYKIVAVINEILLCFFTSKYPTKGCFINVVKKPNSLNILNLYL